MLLGIQNTTSSLECLSSFVLLSWARTASILSFIGFKLHKLKPLIQKLNMIQSEERKVLNKILVHK
jgi:hypothetical protein